MCSLGNSLHLLHAVVHVEVFIEYWWQVLWLADEIFLCECKHEIFEDFVVEKNHTLFTHKNTGFALELSPFVWALPLAVVSLAPPPPLVTWARSSGSTGWSQWWKIATPSEHVVPSCGTNSGTTSRGCRHPWYWTRPRNQIAFRRRGRWGAGQLLHCNIQHCFTWTLKGTH